MSVTGSKSRITSNGSRLWKLGLIANETEVTSRVEPSGGDSATTWEPSTPSAPGRFSTTKDFPVCSVKACEITRATTSGAPPAANGTMIRTFLSG